MITIANNIKTISIIIFVILVIKLIFSFLHKFGSEEKQALSDSYNQAEPAELKGIVIRTIVSRLIILLLGYMSLMLFQNQTLDLLTSMKSAWIRWDSPHYLKIAEHWYQSSGDDKFLIVFYPLYPILIRILNPLIHNYFIAGMIISNICLITASIYLYKLTRLDFNNEISINSVKYLLIFPFSFFLGIAFTDGLFLALTISSFYYLRKRKWHIAGLLGGFASATRSFGILLMVPAIIEFLLENKNDFRNINISKIFTLLKNALFLLLMPLGLLFYMYVNKTVTGDWFRFVTYTREHWGAHFGFFADTIRMLYLNSHSWNPADKISLWIPELAIIFFTFFMIYCSMKHLPVSYSAYMLFYILLISSVTWLLGAGRYSLGIFPTYILMGIYSQNKVVDFTLTCFCLLLSGFYILAYIHGNYVM